MNFEGCRADKSLATDVTNMRLFTCVSSFMINQRTVQHKTLIANFTRIGLFPSVKTREKNMLHIFAKNYCTCLLNENYNSMFQASVDFFSCVKYRHT